MIDLEKLNDSEKVFLKEFKVYNNALQAISDCSNADNLRDELNLIAEEYYKLLEQTSKLVKISDATQLKLRNIQTKLKEQNKQIELQNNKLIKANEIQDKLLKVINLELSRASDYVKSILPQPVSNDHLEISWKFTPSSKLGGDMFGYKMLDKENLSIYLVDVCGHGVRSALYSVSVINSINYHTLPGVDFYSPASVFKGLNKIYDMRQHDDLFFTMFYCILNINTYEMKYSTAGHPPAILISDNKAEFLDSSNFLIGGVQDYEFTEDTCKINTNDNLYIYSDGVYEIRKSENEYLTIDELKELFYINRNLPDNLEVLFEQIQEINFDEALEDDFSIIKLKIPTQL